MTVRAGRRCSAAVADLRPALTRGRIEVAANALATRVLIEGSRAVGIEYPRGGERIVARAEREVILTAGVINSPQLLMLSGIGDPDALRGHDIAASVPLRGVGRTYRTISRRQSPTDAANPALCTRRCDLTGRCPSSRGHIRSAPVSPAIPQRCTAFLKSTPAARLPDVQPMSARR